MKAFKYKRVKQINLELDGALDKLGAQGWELVSSYYDKDFGENIFIFKKELEEIIIKS